MANNPSNMSESEFISYLAKHSILDTKKKEKDDGTTEISFPCPFEGCDDDRRSNEELHCSFNLTDCVYNCLKCGAKGNFVTLLKHFGDYEEYDAEQKAERATFVKPRNKPSLDSMVRNAHKNTRDQAREYFNGRGINDESIDKFMLGLWKCANSDRYMIPVLDKDGKVAYLKLRSMIDEDKSNLVGNLLGQTVLPPKYLVHPAGAKLLLVGEDQLVKSTSSDVLICEGELDRIIAIQEGVRMPVVCGGGGAQTFKDEWIDALKNMRNIYICMDRDNAGESGTEKLARRLAERIPTASIYEITLPFDNDTHADLTDYFVQKRGTAKELFTRYAKYYCGAKPIDETKFKEMTVDDIARVLDSTIKHDFISKTVTFLAMILTYTESDQLNVMFNADSSTGKTYICTEVGKLFPPQDVKSFGKTTPTAFFYSPSLRRKDEVTGQPYIDLERLILIFTEQPDTQLQANLRSILAHDSKRVPFALTNKNKSGRNTADEGYMLGFSSTFFCSANMRIDEQEQTRCLILSPESTQEKLVASIDASIAKNSDKDAYYAQLKNDEARKQLMERIQYIKRLNVANIDIGDSVYLRQVFMKDRKTVLPKTQREVQHFISLVKAMALVNARFRMIDGKIVTTNKDVDEAMKLWGPLSKSMSYGISPQVFSFYKDIILSAYTKKNEGSTQKKGVTYDEIRTEYYIQTGSYPNMENIRKQYIPALKTAALVSCDKDEDDKRQNIVTPLEFFDNGMEEKAQ